MSVATTAAMAAADDVARHPVVVNIRTLGSATAGMLDPETYGSDPEWLALPIARRSAALARLDALRWYLKESDRTVEAAAKAADRADVSQRFFYDMLKAWQTADSPSISLLVPYAKRRATGRPKLSEATERQLGELVAASIGAGRSARDDIVADVAAGWDSSAGPLPAANTLRRHVERLGEGALYGAGGTGHDPTGLDAMRLETTRHGEVLVIDHVGLDIYGDHKTEPAPLTLTLAIDLHTATVAGFQSMLGPPRPAGVRAALLHAQHVARANAGPDIAPRLVLAAQRDDNWRQFVAQLAAQGMDVAARWGAKLHTGMFAQRLIGPYIGPVAISPRVPRDTSARGKPGATFDPRRHAMLTPHEAELVLDAAVRALNADRLAPATRLSRIRLGGIPVDDREKKIHRASREI